MPEESPAVMQLIDEFTTMCFEFMFIPKCSISIFISSSSAAKEKGKKANELVTKLGKFLWIVNQRLQKR